MLRFLFFSGLCIIGISGLTQPADTYPSDVPNAYVRLCRQLTVTTPEISPPTSSRAYGYMGLALYEAVVHGMPGHTSMVGTLPYLPELPLPPSEVDLHWPTVANHAMAVVLDTMFSTMNAISHAALDNLRDGFDAQFEQSISYMILVRSRAYGQAIGQGVLDMARTDGGHHGQLLNYPPTYVPPTGPGMWVPTPGQQALLPYWGEVRPFLDSSVDPLMLPPGPPPFSTVPGSAFHDAAMEVYEVGNTITTDGITTAMYWNDGGMTPPFHSLCMLEMIMRQEQRDLAFAARAYAMVGFALRDAFISCWLTKYTHNLIRPVSYINQNIDPEWTTWIITPPFPEYTSGHSTQSGAWARVMEHLFGIPYAFTDSTHRQLHGGPRTYPDFASAAAEASYARLLGGIHYRFSCDDGLAQGQAVAEGVIDFFGGLSNGLAESNGTSPWSARWDEATGSLVVHGIGPGESLVVRDVSGRALAYLTGNGAHALPGLGTGVHLVDRPGRRAQRVLIP